MVLDTLRHIGLYRTLHPAIDTACDFMAKAKNLPVGRYDLDGGHYVLVQEGETRDGANALFEVHDRYLDLQVVATGTERVEWADRSLLTLASPVDPAKDIGFYRGAGDGFEVLTGMFYLVYPHDAHKPCCHPLSGSCDFRKYVFKLKAETGL